MSTLAINGGQPIRNELHPFPSQKTFGKEEILNVTKFMLTSKILSGYRGNSSPAFWGGEQVRKFETEFENKFSDPLTFGALATNSCTSALQIACSAAGLLPGDEVIVTPWSMSCSATAPLTCGAIPIFADIDPDYFCLDPKSVEEKITPRTRAIIVVDLFGQMYDPRINKIAKKHGLVIIEDAAQAIGSYQMIKGTKVFAGHMGDMGCFSFTQGKHLTAGEGGILVSEVNGPFFGRASLARNHAEAVVSDCDRLNKEDDYVLHCDMIGNNMRLTEIQAVILQSQLKKLDEFIAMRQQNVETLNRTLRYIPPIQICETRDNCTHARYVHGFKWVADLSEGVSRDVFIDAVKAELSGEKHRPDRPLLGCGYIKPLYDMPLFQSRENYYLQKVKKKTYRPLPVVERMYKSEFFLSMYHNLPLNIGDQNDICDAFEKVWKHRGELCR